LSKLLKRAEKDYMKKHIPSLNEYLFLKEFLIGDEFYTSEVSERLSLSKTALGGLLSSLSRSKYIEPIYRENLNVRWKRIK
jgi:hypothetical protein